MTISQSDELLDSAILVLTAMADAAMTFGRIDRTAVYHPDRRTRESDTDHTVALGWLACAAADALGLSLDLGSVAQLALVHDAVEIYAGDTPTLRITPEGRAAKARREHEALRMIHSQFRALPWFPRWIEIYEARVTREARYVWAMDKIAVKFVHLIDGGFGLAEVGVMHEEFTRRCDEQEREISRMAPDMPVLAELYHRLTRKVLAMLP